MPNDALRRARYLESLARLHPSWAHETRSHLGNVSLQIDLMAELLGSGATPAERLGAPLERARGGVARLERCLDRYLGATRPRSGGEGGLGALLAEVGELVAPAARERRVAWPDPPASARGSAPRDPAAAREWLVIAAVGAVFGAPPESAVELRCERAGERALVTVAAPAGAEVPAAPVEAAGDETARERVEGARREWTLEFALEGEDA